MKKISVSLSGHQTSISLEDEFLSELKRICAENHRAVADVIREIDSARSPDTNLSSAIRVWILKNIKNS